MMDMVHVRTSCTLTFVISTPVPLPIRDSLALLASMRFPYPYPYPYLPANDLGFDVDPPAMWVQHGGQMFLPFLGSSTTLKMKDTVQFFIAQMNAMPWGMAAFQKQVLTLLLEVERGK